MKTHKKFISLIIAIITIQIMLPVNIKAQGDIDYALAKSYFTEMDSLCSVDNGKLWGINLYGPTMLVIPESRIIIANQPDNEGKLSEQEGVFIGKLPGNINIANYSIDWSGIKWAIVNWNDPSLNDPYSRNKLLIHESWHSRVEGRVGISPVMTSNIHLDERQGSILFKLELRVLSKALVSENISDKKAALKDALIIRKYRQKLFPGNNENEFERHEGMPEYTGYKLCGLNENIIPKVIAKQLDLAENKDGFANSFAYLTGPAYGFLFDDLNIEWLKQIIDGKSITEIIENVVMVEIPSDTLQLKALVEKIGSNYNYETLIKNETEKFKKQKKLTNLYKDKLIKGNQLIIRNNNLKFTFNPQEKLIPIDNGVVYKTMRLVGEWGILEVNDGIYRSNDWQLFIVPAPKSLNLEIINEDDYVLTLNKGWKIVEIKEGKYTLIKE
ncbi:MAG: hypothetical protein K8R41_08040 [Bacteroidales bacterium]|nr:hypothetical protein [Bacteroidales bacterium]